jgi:RimJ/RimL family protein N-acetyltransferase
MRLETERLILRPIDPERDFDGWARAMADERTVRYLGSKPMSRPESWRNMAMVMGHWAIRGYGFFSVEERGSGVWVGRVGPWYPDGWPAPEVGWAIAPEFQGQGYATEAARASVRFAIAELGWRQVIHVILPGNAASIAVAEKVGSRLVGEQQGMSGLFPDRLLIYGQSADGGPVTV